MAQSKTIQLLRSAALYTPTAAGEGVSAKTALQNAKDALTALSGRKDGEIVLARYQETNGPIKSVLGIYHDTPDLPGTATAGWTFIQDITSSSEGLQTLQNEVDAIESNIGLGTDGSYSGYSGDGIVGTTTTLKGTVDEIIDYIKGLDVTARTNATTDGKVLVTLSEADGLVTETASDLTDVKMGGYTKTSDTGAIASSDTLEVAFSKVENAIASTTVKSTDNTVTITDNSGKDLSVNIDGTTLVAASSTGVISTNLELTQLTSAEVTALSDANVKEAYKLIYATDSNRTAIGNVIKIYKDSALQNVYMGHVDDTLSGQDTTTHESSSSTVVSGTGDDALCFVYQLANGNYKLESVNVQAFLKETEFKDGLTVDTSNHTVSVKVGNGLELGTAAADGNKPVQVKIDSTSEKVITAYGSTNTQSDVLSVGANGVKVSNIQNAIDAKVGTLDVTDTAVAGEYVSAVNETDGIVSMTRAKVADAVLTGYSKGTAPSSGNEAVAATDDVKGAIAKLEHQVDAARTAASTAVSGLDGTADATSVTSGNVPTADFQVLTKVVETDGVVQAVGATNGSTSATLKKLAATGAAADVSIADANGRITATNVEDALQEIALTANGALQSVSSGNGAISVGTEDSNHNQTISLALDTTTATHNITSDMLQITSSGLMMKDTWDCGTF